MTFSKVNADGKALRRSYFVGTLLKMFPEKTVEEIEETTSADCIMTPKSSMAFFLEGLQDDNRASEPSQIEKRKLWNALSKFYLTDSEWKPETEKLLKNCLRSAQR